MSHTLRIALLQDPPDQALLQALEAVEVSVMCSTDLGQVAAEAQLLSAVVVPADERAAWRIERLAGDLATADLSVLALVGDGGEVPAGADAVARWPGTSEELLSARVRQMAAETRAARMLSRLEAGLVDIGDIARDLRERTELEGRMDGFVRRTCDLVGATAGALLLFGKTDRELWVVGSTESVGGVPVPVGERAARNLMARLGDAPDALCEEGEGDGLLARALERDSAEGLERTLVRRVDVQSRRAGALVVALPRGGEHARSQVRGALRLLAELVGAALEDSTLWTRLREQTQPVQIAHVAGGLRRRTLQRYREFFESSSDGVVVLDDAARVVYINRAGAMMTGYAEEWLKGQEMEEIVAEEQRGALGDVVRQGLSGVTLRNFDLKLKTTSGDDIVVDVSASLLSADDALLVLTFRDVTEARELEDELVKTKEFLERLIDSAVDAIVAVDSDTDRILLFNSGAEKLFGHAAEDALARLSFSDLFPEEEYEELLGQLHSPQFGGPGRLAQRQIHVRDAVGQHLPVAMTAASIREEERDVALVAILSDLRETLQMEERLALAQEKLEVTERAALIAELAGTTAHELNQPLTSVIGYSELVLRKVAEESPLRRPVEVIMQEAERMAEIVRKIGKITRYETKSYVGATQILDLDRAADE